MNAGHESLHGDNDPATSTQPADAREGALTSVPLIPAPRSVAWSDHASNTWLTSDPFGQVQVGVNDDLPATEYTLSIHREGASITAGSEAALADARNTFAQIVHLAHTLDPILENGQRRIPGVVINDAPRFAWRGLTVDVARHFMPLADLRRLVDAMAIYRFNVLHLNLTDDQGWRLEIKGYPKLTEVGAWRARTVESIPRFDGSDTYAADRHGGFYTQSELKEFIEFAQARGINILLGINVPGHTQAAIAAYPHLGNAPEQQLLVRETWGVSPHILGVSDEAFRFVRDVLEQAADLSTFPFVFVGGHDVDITEWARSKDAHVKRQEWGYTRESEILHRYTEHARAVLKAKGARMVARDDAPLVRLPDDTLIMHVGDGASLAESVETGFQSVAAGADLALDRVQGTHEPAGVLPALTLKDVAKAQVIPQGLDAAYPSLVMGIHAHASGEYIPTPQHLEYMLFPRAIAIAQQAWGASELSVKELAQRIEEHGPMLDLLGVNSRRL